MFASSWFHVVYWHKVRNNYNNGWGLWSRPGKNHNKLLIPTEPISHQLQPGCCSVVLVHEDWTVELTMNGPDDGLRWVMGWVSKERVWWKSICILMLCWSEIEQDLMWGRIIPHLLLQGTNTFLESIWCCPLSKQHFELDGPVVWPNPANPM